MREEQGLGPDPKRMRLAEIFSSNKSTDFEVLVKGWVRSIRRGKKWSFVVLSDGSSFGDLQVVVDGGLATYDRLKEASVGASMSVRGKIVESPGKGQSLEMQALEVEVIGLADESYPLQKKGHSLEFLREKAHLRPRTKTLSAVFRLRHTFSLATHRFFHAKGLYLLHSPVITGLDCEGAGEMFRVTAWDLENPLPRDEKGALDFSKDYFGSAAYLTVSGQLSAECFAQGLGGCYTMGPTFRSENSQTARHLAEFWMIEPELAFCDLEELADLAEDYLKEMIRSSFEECEEELNFLHGRYAPDLTDELKKMLDAQVRRISYAEALDILKKSKESFEFPVAWGKDLQTEHERFLTEKHFKAPVIVVDYPKEIKAFYMKQNDDGRTVRAMDFLVPGVGELMGGSQREDDLDKLRARMEELGMKAQDYGWYLELRRFGTTPHSGFGLGLERALMYLSGMGNIRDVIPFPRFPGHVGF
ncbi:MAG: asparagine--tRNA ligase [Bacteriovoracales bacterium]|nr:asparagine--tRNA ligase [Bacteriovoracales bacterium]